MSEIAIMTGRFTKTDNPSALPGTCRTCGGDKMTAGIVWFIDMGYSDDWGGVYHCNRCIDSLARFAGYVPKTKKQESQDFELERQLQEYAVQLNTLRTIGIDVNRLLRFALDNQVDVPGIPKGADSVVGDSKGTPESDSKQGSGSVHATSKLGFNMGDSKP